MLIKSEQCDHCGKKYETVYSVDDATWNRFAGLNICLCPVCAGKIAREKGYPHIGKWLTENTQQTNCRNVTPSWRLPMKIEPCPICEWWKDESGNWRTTEPTRWEIHTVEAVEGGAEG